MASSCSCGVRHFTGLPLPCGTSENSRWQGPASGDFFQKFVSVEQNGTLFYKERSCCRFCLGTLFYVSVVVCEQGSL